MTAPDDGGGGEGWSGYSPDGRWRAYIQNDERPPVMDPMFTGSWTDVCATCTGRPTVEPHYDCTCQIVDFYRNGVCVVRLAPGHSALHLASTENRTSHGSAAHGSAAPCSAAHGSAAPCSAAHGSAAPCSAAHGSAAPCSAAHGSAAQCSAAHGSAAPCSA
eukprot:Lankesteria_metandrocarpae@DN2575_c0_g1_i3.p1